MLGGEELGGEQTEEHDNEDERLEGQEPNDRENEEESGQEEEAQDRMPVTRFRGQWRKYQGSHGIIESLGDWKRTGEDRGEEQ